MGKIEIWEDCLVPERWFELSYTGPDPWGVVRKIENSLENFFQISAAGHGNYMLKWDDSGDPINFLSRWWVNKSFSNWSKFRLFIIVQGYVKKADKTGGFTMRFKASLQTQFKGWWIFTKPLWKIYSHLFYNRARMNFIERCQELALGFRDLVKKEYDMKVPAEFKFAPIARKGGLG
jgi:hypothetical protein